jgi:hypothetical protein
MREIIKKQVSDVAPYDPKIYSNALWNLYDDICQVFYGRLPPEAREKILEKLPCGINEIERTADKLLMRHVAILLERIGPQQYASLVRDNMTREGWIIFLLRCLIACYDADSQPDILEIRTNRAMGSMELAALVRASGDKSQEFVDDDGKAISVESIDVSGMFTLVSRTEMRSSKTAKDRMPNSLVPTIREALDQMGIKMPKDLKEAWAALEPRWKAVSVDEKIVSRIAYLIVNSTANRNSKVKVELLTFKKKSGV